MSRNKRIIESLGFSFSEASLSLDTSIYTPNNIKKLEAKKEWRGNVTEDLINRMCPELLEGHILDRSLLIDGHKQFGKTTTACSLVYEFVKRITEWGKTYNIMAVRSFAQVKTRINTANYQIIIIDDARRFNKNLAEEVMNDFNEIRHIFAKKQHTGCIIFIWTIQDGYKVDKEIRDQLSAIMLKALKLTNWSTDDMKRLVGKDNIDKVIYYMGAWLEAVLDRNDLKTLSKSIVVTHTWLGYVIINPAPIPEFRPYKPIVNERGIRFIEPEPELTKGKGVIEEEEEEEEEGLIEEIESVFSLDDPAEIILAEVFGIEDGRVRRGVLKKFRETKIAQKYKIYYKKGERIAFIKLAEVKGEEAREYQELAIILRKHLKATVLKEHKDNLEKKHLDSFYMFNVRDREGNTLTSDRIADRYKVSASTITNSYIKGGWLAKVREEYLGHAVEHILTLPGGRYDGFRVIAGEEHIDLRNERIGVEVKTRFRRETPNEKMLSNHALELLLKGETKCEKCKGVKELRLIEIVTRAGDPRVIICKPFPIKKYIEEKTKNKERDGENGEKKKDEKEGLDGRKAELYNPSPAQNSSAQRLLKKGQKKAGGEVVKSK